MIPEEAAEESNGWKLTTFAISFSCYRVQITGGEIPRRTFEDFCGYASRYLTYHDMAVPWMEEWWTERVKDIHGLNVRTVCLGRWFLRRAFNRVLLTATRWLWRMQGTKMFDGMEEQEEEKK